MAYIPKDDFISKYLLKAGTDLLKSTDLNVPHSALAANMDTILPLLEYIQSKMGENYTVERIDGSYPAYGGLSGTNFYIKDGQSFKEAIITLDNAARDLYNFILSQSDQPTGETPFIIPGNPTITPLPGDQWYIVPDSILSSNVEGPAGMARVNQIPPMVWSVGYAGPKHLIALYVSRYGDAGVNKMFQSFDAGDTWSLITNYNNHDMWSWKYNVNWTGAYRRPDGHMDFGYGMGYSSNPARKWRGNAYYDTSTSKWAFVKTQIDTGKSYWGLDLRRSRTRGALGTFKYEGTENPVISHMANNFSSYKGTWVDGRRPILNPTTLVVGWKQVRGISAIQLSDGTIVGVIAGRPTASDSKFQLYSFFSYDDGDTYTVPTRLPLNTEYHYAQPYIIQLSNGGIVLNFTTNEGSADANSILGDKVKIVISTDSGQTFKNKVTVYESPYKLSVDKWWSNYAKTIQLPNGEIYCFFEETRSYINRALVRIKLRIEV